MTKVEEVYEQIKDIGSWFSKEDVNEIYKLKLPKKSTILELGSGHGRSTKAIKLLYPTADITTCDPGIQNSVEFFEELGVTLIGKRGDELKWNRLLDLLFVDDDHNTQTVKDDIDKYKRFIRKGGYIVFHDYYGTGVQEGVDSRLKVRAVKTGEFSMAIWRNK